MRGAQPAHGVAQDFYLHLHLHGKREIIATTDLLKAQVANCFSKVIMFHTLMEKIKMRMVLEDELDILVSLFFELVNFHEFLIPLDFKLT